HRPPAGLRAWPPRASHGRWTYDSRSLTSSLLLLLRRVYARSRLAEELFRVSVRDEVRAALLGRVELLVPWRDVDWLLRLPRRLCLAEGDAAVAEAYKRVALLHRPPIRH